ncbi:hypothetical protein N9O88_00685 [bacterium]|nr:hypothetical protein [bacterium]
MPLFKFRANSYMRGFLINAFITALISAILIEIRVSYESKGDFKWIYETLIPPGNYPGDPHKKIIITFFNGFMISMLVYLVFYFITGFGGGFIIPKDKINFW